MTLAVKREFRMTSPKKPPKPATSGLGDVLGPHPDKRHALGGVLAAVDRETAEKIPHRVLTERPAVRAKTTAAIQAALTQHHASAEALERTKKHREALKRLGFTAEQAKLRRFPTNPSTRKGNLAEIVLNERRNRIDSSSPIFNPYPYL
jgi:hypothetical protein